MSLGYNERAYQATFANGSDSRKKEFAWKIYLVKCNVVFQEKFHELLTFFFIKCGYTIDKNLKSAKGQKNKMFYTNELLVT